MNAHSRFLLLLLLSAIALAGLLAVLPGAAEGAIIIVPDDYAKIQDAIGNAVTDDTIRIYAGTYSETVVIDKRLFVQGNGTAETIIQSTASFTVNITAPGTNLSGVQIKGATSAGLAIVANGCVIENVLCTGNFVGLLVQGAQDSGIGDSNFSGNSDSGILIRGGSDRTHLERLICSGNSFDGIHTDSVDHITIADSDVNNNANYGIYAITGQYHKYTRNTINDNKWGVYLVSCQGCDFGFNSVRDNDGHGLGMWETGGTPVNRFHNNTMERNGLVLGGIEGGVSLGGGSTADSNIVENNLISGNQHGIVILFGGATSNIIRGNMIRNTVNNGIHNFFNPGPNTFYNNNFISNKKDVQAPNALDVFDNGYPQGGNFWDRYNGNDSYSGPAQNIWGPDGIGDTAHVISGGIVDNFPLYHPYNDPMDSIAIINPPEGALVEGRLVAEAVVVSRSVLQVDWYLDGIHYGYDTTAPFNLVLDTTAMAEDTKYILTASMHRERGIPVNDSVTFMVNNAATYGAYLGVATVSTSYQPDDRVTAIVTLTTPPGFDSIVLQASYADSAGNRVQVLDQMYPASGRYGFSLLLASDVATGTASLDVHAMAYLRGSQVWTADATTSFTVTGMSAHQELAALLANLSSVRADIDGLNLTTQALLAQALVDIMSTLDGMGAAIGTTLDAMWADLNVTSDADLATTLVTLSAMWDGINGTALAGFDSLLVNLSVTEATILDEMTLLQAYLVGEIDLSSDEVRSSLQTMWGALNDSFADLDTTIEAQLDELEGSMASNTTAIRDYLDLRTAQLELYMGLVNASIHLHLAAIEQAMSDFEGSAMVGLDDVSAYLREMEGNGSARHAEVLSDLEDTLALLDGINASSLPDLRDRLVTLRDGLSDLDDSEGERHANTVDALVGELDALDTEVSDRFNQTEASLGALSTLDTILAELDRVSADVADTKEAVEDEGAGSMYILLLLLLFSLVTLCLVAVVMLRMRSTPPPPPPPPVAAEPVTTAELEPVAPPAPEDFEMMAPSDDGWEAPEETSDWEISEAPPAEPEEPAPHADEGPEEPPEEPPEDEGEDEEPRPPREKDDSIHRPKGKSAQDWVLEEVMGEM